MKKIFLFRKAQLLVETIIGIGLVTLVLVAIVPLFLVGVKAGTESWKVENARFLAQEAMEEAFALKEENWNNIYRPLNTSNKGISNVYSTVRNGNAWALALGSENIALNGLNYTRSLTIENVSRTGQNGAGDLENIYVANRDDPSTQKITVNIAWPGSSGLSVVNYFTRFKNAIFSQTDWSGGPGQENFQNPPNKYFSANQIDSATAGELKLALVPGGTANDGNQFVTNSLSNIGRLNNAAFRNAIRFTAQKSASVNQIRLYVSEVSNGGSVTYSYGIQGDSLVTPGTPSGTYLSSATAAFSTTGWQTVNIPSVSLTLGTTYYIVVQHNSGSNPSGNRYINFRATIPANYIIPKAGITDINLTTLHYNGAWNILTQSPIFLLRYVDNTYDGNPYDNFADRQIYGVYFEGEAVTYAANTGVSGVGLYVARRANQSPQANLDVTVVDVTNGTTLVPTQTCLLPVDVTTAFAWKECNFSAGSVTFPANSVIRIYFSSPATTSQRSYLINNVSNPATAEYTGINWKSTDAITTRSTNSGGSFSDSTFIDMSYYLKVASNTSYAPFGELISSTVDTGNVGGAGFNRISWSPLGVLPLGTSVRMQLAVNSDNVSWTNWYGPTGLGTWYTLASGENIYTKLYDEQASQPARYFRYKVRLETSNQSVTPRLDSLKINYSP